MEGTEDTRDEVAAADTVVADEGNTGTEEKRKSTGSRRSGAPSPKPEPVEDAADDAAEDEDKDVEEEEVKLVPKSKSKDSMKREEIEMNDHAVAPPVAAASAEGTTENNDVEQGKQNGLNHPDKTDSEKKSMLQLMKKREIIICFIGGITFLIGLIMIIVGLMVMQSRCDRQLLVSILKPAKSVLVLYKTVFSYAISYQSCIQLIRFWLEASKICFRIHLMGSFQVHIDRAALYSEWGLET